MDVKVPILPENTPSAEITELCVSQGDIVTVNDVLLKIQADNCVIEVMSPMTGIVSGFACWLGRVVNSGHFLCSIVASMEMKAPLFPPNIGSGKVVALHVNEGDLVTTHKTMLEVEADRMVMEVIAPATGKVTGFNLTIGQEVTSEQALCSIVACDDDGTPYDVPAEEDVPIELPRFYFLPYWLNVTIAILVALILICFFVWLIRFLFFTGF